MVNETEPKVVEKINPFFSIWLSPRKTARYVLDHKDLRYSLIIAAIGGISSAISAANEFSKGFEIQLWMMLIGIIVLGPIFGLISLGIITVMFTWVGKWFGGVGTFKQMAQAMGLVSIPNIWFTPYWILSAIFIYNDLFTINVGSEITTGAIVWSIVTFLIMMTYSIWMIVIQSKIIGEVHQFSSWRGFATLIIPSILFGIIVFIFVFFLVFAFIV